MNGQLVRIIRLVVPFLIAFSLNGCVTDINEKGMEARDYGEVVPGEILTAPVKSSAALGEAMLTAGEYSRTPRFMRKKTVVTQQTAIARINHGLKKFNFDLPPRRLELLGSSGEGFFYQYPKPFPTQNNQIGFGGLFVSRDAPYVASRIYWTWSPVHTSSRYYTAMLEKPVDLDAEEILVPLDHGTEQGPMAELIYSGVSAGQIRFVYREFTVRGSSRPDFTQDVTLDYKPGEIYAFRSARFKVDKAGPEKIEFTLIQGL